MEKTSTPTIMPAYLTKRGLIALWERGGSMSTSGSATIIVQDDGKRPCAAYINPPGPISNGEHALVPLRPGFYIIKTKQEDEAFEHEVYKILKTFTQKENGQKKGFIQVRQINRFTNGKWQNQLAQKLSSAIKAAERKATTYLCRAAVFVKEPPSR